MSAIVCSSIGVPSAYCGQGRTRGGVGRLAARDGGRRRPCAVHAIPHDLSLIHISEPTRRS
eukprot:7383440-Prymnesium_polylepis.1